MKYYIAEGKGQKQPPGPDGVGLTGTRGVEVIEGRAGQMTDRGTPGKATSFSDGKYFDSARSHRGGQASSVLKRNQEAPLIKHPTQTHDAFFTHTHGKLLFLLLNSLVSSSQRGEVALRKRIKFRSAHKQVVDVTVTVTDICNDPRFTHFNATKSLLGPPLVSGLKGF